MRGALRRCDRVGSDSVLLGKPYIVNQGRIVIGDCFRLSSEPVTSHLVTEPGGTIEIGDDVSIAHGSGVASRASIRIGDGTRLGAYVLVLDNDYHVPGLASARPPARPIEIGRGVRIGNHVTVLRGTRIADGARIMDGAVVSREVGAGVTAAGVPARALTNEPESARDPRESVAERLPELVMRTLRLEKPPRLEHGPAQIPGWDSLGALALILALEEELGVALSEDEMMGVQNLADVVRLVEARAAQARLVLGMSEAHPTLL